MNTEKSKVAQGRHYEIKPKGPLKGEIELSGAKNAATKQIIASLLTDEECVLENIPDILDTRLTMGMCHDVGSEFSFKNGVLKITTKKIKKPEISASYTGRNRVPILFFGPLLHRYGKAIVPVVGGDKIGKRPIDFHLNALKKMGADIKKRGSKYIVRAKKLHGADIFLPFPSVGATENVLLCASLAEGRTIIRNAAIEPEIIDLMLVLQKMGTIIEIRSDRTFVIKGVKKLKGFKHRVILDRTEAVSFACAVVASGGDAFIKGASQLNLLTFLNKIRLVGAEFEVKEDGIRFWSNPRKLKAISIETNVHPGFMTDWQAPFVILLTQAKGESVVHETVFENRFGYTNELVKMGANIKLSTRCLNFDPCRFYQKNFFHSCIIFGKTPLKGGTIVVPDIRAGFSYLIAAAIAKGTSKVYGIEHIERGYENIINKFKSLGLEIKVRGKV
ncbi:UDP-N-acetylglucosamine 1-carboxyvinyltransferase [bacterium]|nr:UDP-N-acetylglucosamine 1-carboxyvinyltransferase [bacterium]